MDRVFIFRVLFAAILIFVIPPHVQAGLVVRKKEVTDTVPTLRQEEKKEKGKEKPDNKQEPNKPDVREVPKARKQSRPPVVAKPNIKVKPIKVIRPKIKKP
jgi:hypothetical protein